MDMSGNGVNRLRNRVVALVVAVMAAVAAPCAVAQTGLYVPAKGPVRNMQKALHNPEVFYLLLCYEGSAPTYSVSDLDLLDSAYRIAFDVDNPMYYTMAVEAYGDGNEALGRERVDGVYRYFAMRGGQRFPVRVARNNIHCSCMGDTVETLRFEVPVATAVYNAAELPESRRLLNKSIALQNCVLVTFRNDPDECVGTARGCYVPAEDSIVRGYYASLSLAKGSVRAVDNTKDTCPSGLEITVEDHLDYRKVVEQYSLVPHRKQLIVQAGYIVIKSNWAQAIDSCTQPQKDSIFVRIPATPEQVAAKLKFFAKVKGKRGEEYRQLPTRKLPGRAELMLQAPINATQFDTIYVGKRIQEGELGRYFYSVDGPTEAAAFKVGDRYWVAYRVGKGGQYELKKHLMELFRVVPEQEEEELPETSSDKKINPEEIID
ncbi:MAG: hypothetical protein J6I41_01125 [Bacteroidales bacterium]|nr:hypothetical protein [Bacteroidales bacterium]